MREPDKKRGRKRVYDAEKTRGVILDAAEMLFAEHGFDGVSVDAIAGEAGYNKSLIFQYFGDKLGLYTAVVKRADSALTELLAQAFAPLPDDATIVADASAFKTFLEQLTRSFFDYLVAHPRFMRMLLWEQAEGWQTYTTIAADLTPDRPEQIERLFSKARESGLLRSHIAPMLQVSMVLQICLSYLAFLPLYEPLLGQRADLRSHHALARAREEIVGFVVEGMMGKGSTGI